MLPENVLVQRTDKKDLRKNATPIATNPSNDKIELLSSTLSLSSESGVSSKSNTSSESDDSSGDEL